MPNTAANEEDIIAANERLTGQLATITAERDAALASVGTVTTERDAMARERDEVRSNLATITAERDAARTSLQAMTADRDRLAGQERDFNRGLAAALAKHGIRGEGIATDSGKPNVASIDPLTARCLEVTGKTLSR